jgi:hypothetical protein
VGDNSDRGKPMGDYTQWIVFRDHANRVYFWRSYDDTGLNALDLKTVDFSAGKPMRSLAIGGQQARRRYADPGPVGRPNAVVSASFSRRLCLRTSGR